MDRSKGFFITVICFVYFVICVLSVVYFFFSNFSFFSLDYITPVSFLGTLLTIPQALFLMSIFILITSLILLSKIKSMVTFLKKQLTYLLFIIPLLLFVQHYFYSFLASFPVKMIINL